MRRTAVAASAAPGPAAVVLRAAEARDVAALAAIEALCAGASAQWNASDIEVRAGGASGCQPTRDGEHLDMKELSVCAL